MEQSPGRRRWRRLALWVPLALVGGLVWFAYGRGALHPVGVIEGPRLDPGWVALRSARQESVAPTDEPGLVLFGDLHVHTTFSADAFMRSLPLMAGEGLHPPADACDFARYCSDLDFFALTDHAEALTPRMWRESIESMRACAARADGAAPDLVPFMGFEWSQVGATPATHYGHKNVIYPGLEPGALPARPIGAGGAQGQAISGQGVTGPARMQRLALPLLDLPESRRYADLLAYMREVAAVDLCPAGVPSPELPTDCRELAADPADLFARLDAWGLESLVIPHGTSWGLYTPPGYTWDKQLDPAQDDPRQRLVEVYSGHGNAEPYRPWRHVVERGDGTLDCPPPSPGFEPCCWRAGAIMQARCAAAGEPEAVCAEKARKARLDYAASGVAGRRALEGATAEDWGDCGQCTDCALPTFNHRPAGSVQYMLARGHFEAGQPPRHTTLGFIASSDTHSARPGTGYKEVARRRMTEAAGGRSPFWRRISFGAPGEPTLTSRAFTAADTEGESTFRVLDMERQASFFMTGGLVAVHAAARSREAIFAALVERRVYGTSGPRILLWFDLLDGPDGPATMGQAVVMQAAPRFRVRAAGGFAQKPGCPPHAEAALGAERLERLCAGECYHPGDAREPIARVEVVRIRRQITPEEDVADLIDDPWRVLPCPAGREVCEVEFDGDPPEPGREALYYVRAIQAPTDAVNGAGLRCADGVCAPCFGDHRTDFTDDCLAPVEERAWSSPIYVRRR